MVILKVSALSSRCSVRFLWAAIVLGTLVTGTNTVVALDTSASDWSPAQNARMRLIAGAPLAKGDLRAGIEITLAPDYKTYWRTPGESGVPPLIDFSGSVNLDSADVRFPMPHIYNDAGGKAYGYKEHVVLPVRVKPKDPNTPVTLTLKLAYGVCAKLCIPAEGTASLTLPPQGSFSPPGSAVAEKLLSESEARVPERKTVNAPGAIRVTGSGTLPPVDGHAIFTVSVESAASTELLAEANPADWFLEVKPGEWQRGRQDFIVSVYDPETGKSRIPCDIRLTVQGGVPDHPSAIEVPMRPTGCVDLP